MTVENLIKALDTLVDHLEEKKVKDDRYIFIHELCQDEEGNIIDTEIKNLYNVIESIADSVLITPKGQAHYANHSLLSTNSAGKYTVRCLEKDSFGWLVGGIVTPKGIVAYG